MSFILYPDPRLGLAAAPRPVDDRLRAIGARLLTAIGEVEAFGLAAAHIGEVAPMIVVNVAPEGPRRRDQLFYNPCILATAAATASGPEASVSMPGIEVDIARPLWVEIAYDDAAGMPQTARFEGFVARCAIHEIEQMQGIFFIDRLSRLKRNMALKKYRKAQRTG